MKFYKSLRDANLARTREWDPDNKLSLTFFSTELAGEVGEACNVIKKMERARLGLRGSYATPDQLAEELADVAISTDLVALHSDIDLEHWIRLKFNSTSDKYGLSIKMIV